MNEKTKLVFLGFLELSHSERQEFIDEWNEYREMALKSQIRLKENFRMDLGPLTTIRCPCCGR